MKLQFDNIIREDESVENILNVLFDFVCVLCANDFQDDSIKEGLFYVERKYILLGINPDVVLLDLRDLLRMSIYKNLSYGTENKDS